MKIHTERREVRAREKKRKNADILLGKISRIEIQIEESKKPKVARLSSRQGNYTVLARSLIKKLKISDYRIILIRNQQKILGEYFWSGTGLFDYLYVRQNLETFPGIKFYSTEREDRFFTFVNGVFSESELYEQKTI